MDIRQLAVFNAVVRHGSLSKAGEEYLLSQPSVSLYVKALEQEFGCTLLFRNSRGVRPTEAGRQLYKFSARLLREINGLHESLQKANGTESRRVLRLGATKLVAPAILPALLKELDQTDPNLIVQWEVGQSHNLFDLMIEGKLDSALVSVGVNVTALRRVTIEETYAAPLVLLAAPEERNPEIFWDGQPRKEIRLRDLSDMRYVGPDEDSQFGLWLREEMMRRGIAGFKPVLITGDMESQKQVIAQGHGVGILPELAVSEEIRRRELRTLPIPGMNWAMAFCLISPPVPAQSQNLEVMRATLRHVFQSIQDDGPMEIGDPNHIHQAPVKSHK